MGSRRTCSWAFCLILVIGIIRQAASQMTLTGFDNGAEQGSRHELKCAYPGATSYMWTWTSATASPVQKQYLARQVVSVASVNRAQHEGTWECKATVNTATHIDRKFLFVYCTGITMESSTKTPTQGLPFSVGCVSETAVTGDLDIVQHTIGKDKSISYPVKQAATTKTGQCSILVRPQDRIWTPPSTCGAVSSGSSKLNLTTDPAKLTDTGYWRCYDSARKCAAYPVLLNVYVPPKVPVVIFVGSAIPKEGQAYELQCQAWQAGVVNITYSWTKNGNPFSTNLMKNSSKLTFTSIKKTDAGSYLCHATDAISNKRISAPKNVTVYYKPHWDPKFKQVHKMVAKIGDIVTLTAHIVSNPSPTVKWFKEQTSLSGNTSRFLPTMGSPTSYMMTLKSGLVVDDYGVYTVKAEIIGMFPVVAFVIKISAPPGNVTMSGLTTPAIAGTDKLLMCNAWQNGALGINYSWFRNASKISKGNASEITFRPVKANHDDIFRCEATNGQFKKNATGKLTVYYKPELDPSKEFDKDNKAKLGVTSSFTVHIVARPPPHKATWWRQQAVIREDDSNFYTKTGGGNTTFILFLHKVRAEDYGLFKVELENEAGISSIEFELKTHGLLGWSDQEWALRAGAGVLGLVIIIVISVVIWRCRCIGRNRKNKKVSEVESKEQKTEIQLSTIERVDIVRTPDNQNNDDKDTPVSNIPEYTEVQEVSDRRSMALPEIPSGKNPNISLIQEMEKGREKMHVSLDEAYKNNRRDLPRQKNATDDNAYDYAYNEVPKSSGNDPNADETYEMLQPTTGGVQAGISNPGLEDDDDIDQDAYLELIPSASVRAAGRDVVDGVQSDAADADGVSSTDKNNGLRYQGSVFELKSVVNI